MAERIRTPDSALSSSVSDQQSVGSSPSHDTWLSKTLNHCFVLRMGRKAVGLVLCNARKIIQCTYRVGVRPGAPVFLAVAAECAVAPCKPL